MSNGDMCIHSNYMDVHGMIGMQVFVWWIGQIDSWLDCSFGRQTDEQIDGQMDRQTDRKTDRQIIDTQIDRAVKVALVDGGATHALRRGIKSELENAEPVMVELAHGSSLLP